MTLADALAGLSHTDRQDIAVIAAERFSRRFEAFRTDPNDYNRAWMSVYAVLTFAALGQDNAPETASEADTGAETR